MKDIRNVIRSMQNLNKLLDTFDNMGLVVEDNGVGAYIFGSLTLLENIVCDYVGINFDNETDEKRHRKLADTGIFENSDLSDEEIDSIISNAKYID